VTATSLHSVQGLRLERFFAELGPRARHLLCTSDIEPLRLRELLDLADPGTRELWDGLALGYTEPGGMPALRAEIAGTYTAIEPDEVVTFTGADEAIFLALNAILRPGDHAVVTWPAYQSLQEVAYAAGADVTLLPLDRDSGWALDLDALRRAIRPTTRVVIVNFPHNPTGALPDRATLDAAEAIAAEVGACFFSDEVYRHLEYDAADLLPAAADYGGQAVSVGVMSKAFGLAGLRIGWIATKDRDLLERISTYKEYISACNSAPSEVLALIALRARAVLFDRSLGLLAGTWSCSTASSPSGRGCSNGYGRAQAASGSPGSTPPSTSRHSPCGSSSRRACCSSRARSTTTPATTSGSGSAMPISPRRWPGSNGSRTAS